MCAIQLASASLSQGKKCPIFNKLSTTTSIESTLLVIIGKPSIKSINRSSQIVVRTRVVAYRLLFCVCLFACWKIPHLSTNLVMPFFFIFGQKNHFVMKAIVLSLLVCAASPPKCRSCRTYSLIEVL